MVEKRHFPAMALQLGAACAICSFVFLTMQDYTPRHWFYPLVIIPYSLLVYIINILLLRKERSLRDVAILNGTLGIALFVSIAVFGDYESWPSLIFAAIFCAYITMRGYQSAETEPGLRTIMLCMELSLIILVLFSAYCGYFVLPVKWCLPAIVGCAVTILGVMLSRMERSPGLRGWIFVLAVFALILMLLWVLVSFAAAPAGEGVVALWNTLVDTVKFILGLIWKFILFLISLLPQTEYEEPPMEAPVFDMPEYQEFTEQQLNLMGAIAFVAAVAGAILLIRLLIYLGKFKTGGKTVGARNSTKRQRPSLVKGLGHLLCQLWSKMCLKMRIWRRRDTPGGLLCILISKCRMGPWHKTPGETPREFLSRLRHASRHDEKLRDALDGMIPLVDMAVYSSCAENVTVPGAALIRRRIGRAVRGQFIRRMKKRIIGKLKRA